MLRSKVFISISLILSVFLLSVFINSNKTVQHQFVIQEQRTAVEYVNVDVEIGDQIEVQWIHSVELTPWIEVYEISEEMKLMLIETRFQSYGAGVPDTDNGTIFVENGYTVIRDIDEVIDRFNWIHSHEVNFELRANGIKVANTSDLPHHIPMEFLIR